MSTGDSYKFIGTDLYVGLEWDVYSSPVHPGVYWADRYRRHNVCHVECWIESAILVCDDFGNLIDAFGGAQARHAFRQVLH